MRTTRSERGTRARLRAAVAVVIGLSLLGVAASDVQNRPANLTLAAASDPMWQGWASGPDAGARKLAALTASTAPATRSISVDATNPQQTWLGTGATLTDAAVTLMQQRPAAIARLYDPAAADGAHLNLLRLPLTATDLTDPKTNPATGKPTNLWSFSWNANGTLGAAPTQAVTAVDVAASVKSMQPQLQVLATPWSAPQSMKRGGVITGAPFITSKRTAYANMLDAQASWLLSRGVPLRYMTIANEPGYAPRNYPGMTMTDLDMAAVAKTLDPKLQRRGVELWALDHNWEDAGRVKQLRMLAPSAFQGAAFHCYGKTSPANMTGLGMPVAVTECTGMSGDDITGTFAWDSQYLVRDAINAGSRALLMWSLALDPSGGPKIPKTCHDDAKGECRGLLQINPATGTILPQAEFYTLAHLSRAGDPGSRVLPVTASGDIFSVAFSNPDGTVGAYGFNNTGSTQIVSVRVAGGGERRFQIGAHELFTLRGAPGAPDANPRGRILISPDGARFYIDTTGYRHPITSDAVFVCNGGWANTSQNVPWTVINAYPQAEAAACFTAHAGDIIRHPDGDAYVLDADGNGLLRRWIPTGTDYTCARAEGRAVVTVTRYQVAEIRSGSNRPGGNCIIRGPGGDSHFVNNEGRREWIPDSPTWDCEVGRGVPMRDVPAGFVDGVAEVGWHYCLNKANLRNKVLRHADGDAYFIHPNDTKTWIPDGATFACRTRQGAPVTDTRWREYVNAFPGSEWDYCYDINTMKGRIVTHPDGDSHYIDTDGTRHWIPSAAVYSCLRARGIPADTIRWRQYITNTPEREWAVCGDTLTTNQKLDRGQWLQSSDGRYRLHMQGDGNLVVYNAAGRAIWATNRVGAFTIVQGDGNLVEYTAAGVAVWATNSTGRGGNRLVMQSDGNLVLYSPSRAVWASNTVGR